MRNWILRPAAESKFCIGTAESQNLIGAEAIQKALADEKCDVEVALIWAAWAKNALQDHSGPCPNEFVFGFNVNTPSILTDQLPSLHSTTSNSNLKSSEKKLYGS